MDSADHRWQLTEKLVLVADDQRVNRHMLSLMLEQLDISTVTAADGVEAIEMFEQHKPELVLMDINMPRMDGFEATRQIKRRSGDLFVPIVFITGEDDEQKICQGITEGGDDFLKRPFSFDNLKAKITAMRRIRNLNQKLLEVQNVRKREEEIAVALFDGAVESGNVALDQIRIYKRPAEAFSGDVQLTAYRPDGGVNILLGDFTGHGLTATIGALPMSETFRAMTQKGYGGQEVLGQINRKLNQLLPTGMFLAMAMVSMSADGGHVQIWNGGLPDVMIVDGFSGEIQHRIVSAHPPLGIISTMMDSHFQSFQLKPSDRILMLSDGVIEASNAKGELFGEERLIEAIRMGARRSQITEQIIASVGGFMLGTSQDDDISLIEIPGVLQAREEEWNQRSSDLALAADVADDRWEWSMELNGGALRRLNPVAMALSRLQECEGDGEHWHSVFTILTELYVNALDHGVLELNSALKSSPEGFAEYFQQREIRLDELVEGSVGIEMQVSRLEGGGMLRFSIKDSGAGFDYNGWLEKIRQGTLAEGLSGRGIKLVDELCESLEYSENGTRVEVIYLYQQG